MGELCTCLLAYQRPEWAKFDQIGLDLQGDQTAVHVGVIGR